MLAGLPLASRPTLLRILVSSSWAYATFLAAAAEVIALLRTAFSAGVADCWNADWSMSSS